MRFLHHRYSPTKTQRRADARRAHFERAQDQVNERRNGPIVVRSLHQVGGERPDRVYRRQKDAKARKQGFLSFMDMALYFEKLQRLAGQHR